MIYKVLRSGIDEYERHTLQHWGIKGQKWGVRRYENEDGTLTDEGKARYRKDAAEARREIGESARNPMDSVGTLEGRYMMTGWGGGKYRRLNKTIMNNTRSEAKEYDKARWEATKAKTEKNAILFRKTREELAKETVENQRKAGRKFSDAVASISVQYINERFPERNQGKAKAWVYSQYAQGLDKQIQTNFDEYNNG